MLTPETLVRRAHGLVAAGRRGLLGIAGPPGSGKTTFAEALVDRLRDRPPAGWGRDWVVHVPMDGYHLADAELARLGRLHRKGAPDTFDAGGYAALLGRLADDGDEVVYAPGFDRELEQPVAGSIAIGPGGRLVITEGNYLLVQDSAWADARRHLSEVWYIELSEQERLRRLIARHQQFGKSELAASDWAHGIDQRNADLVVGTCERADLRVAGDVLGHPGQREGERRSHVPGRRTMTTEGLRRMTSSTTHTPHEAARAAILDAMGALLDVSSRWSRDAARGADAPTGCPTTGVLVHLHLGLHRVLYGILTPTGRLAAQCEVPCSYRPDATFDADAARWADHQRFVSGVAAAYAHPTALADDLAAAVDAASLGVVEMEPGALLVDDELVCTGDFLQAWAAEIHGHLAES